MTDVEVLRDAVINAARAWKRDHHLGEPNDLADALDALDEAERPDPWELLRQYTDDAMEADGHTWEEFLRIWEPRVEAALAWREANPDA